MKRTLSLLVTILLIFNLSACEGTEKIETNTEAGRIYECDYKSLNINTKITTTFDGEEINIVGNIFRIFRLCWRCLWDHFSRRPWHLYWRRF